MAQRIQTLFTDDLDGSDAEGTVRFGLDGTAYEIDLNADHAGELRGILAPYVEAGRRAGGTSPAHGKRSGSRAPGSTARVLGGLGNGGQGSQASGSERREYLRTLGHEVKDRGKLPAHLAEIPVPPRESWIPTAGVLAPELPRLPARDEVEAAAREAAEAQAKPAEVTPSADAVATAAADAILAEADNPPADEKEAAKPAAAKAAKVTTAKAGATKFGGYDAEQRAKAVAMTQEPGATIAGTSRALGISEGSLRNWIKAAGTTTPAAAK